MSIVSLKSCAEKLQCTKVSVVIPAYNAERWISESVKSVVEQTYEHLEIVLVDDGSTDCTAELAEESLRRGRFPYRILVQPNGGAAAARNRGWQAARGEWVQFLDSDDLLHPRKVEVQIAQLVAHQAVDVLYSDWRRLVWSDGAWREDDDIRAPIIGPDALADILSDRNFLQLGCQMFRRNVLELTGGFDRSHEPIEDVGLCLKIAMAGGAFVKARSNGAMSWYRDRPRSLSKSNQRQFIESCIKNGKLAEQYVFANRNCSSKTIEAIVDVYYFGARYFAEHDWNRFDEIVRDIEVLRPAFVPKTPAQLKVLSRIVGYRKAERLGALYRKGRSIGAKLWLDTDHR